MLFDWQVTEHTPLLRGTFPVRVIQVRRVKTAVGQVCKAEICTAKAAGLPTGIAQLRASEGCTGCRAVNEDTVAQVEARQVNVIEDAALESERGSTLGTQRVDILAPWGLIGN